MKIEDLHEILKKKHKKYVSRIEEVPSYDGYPAFKEFFIAKKNFILKIAQTGKKKCFEFYIQDNNTGEGVTIGTKMDGSKVIVLVDLLM